MRCVQDPKFPWQVPNNSRDMGGTPLHLVHTIVAQRYRNAGRQEGQKEEQNAIVSGWIGWIHSPEKPKKQRRIKKEGEGWEGPAVTFHLQCLTPSPEEILRLSVINKAACCMKGTVKQIKKIILGCSHGSLVWCLNFGVLDKAGTLWNKPKRLKLVCSYNLKWSKQYVYFILFFVWNVNIKYF